MENKKDIITLEEAINQLREFRDELLSEILIEEYEKYKYKISNHYDYLYLANKKILKEYINEYLKKENVEFEENINKLIGEGIEPTHIITQEELDNIKNEIKNKCECGGDCDEHIELF